MRSAASTPVLLLAVGPLAQRGGWAADACISLAEAMAQAGQRVVVADLSLDRPELHERLGTDNTEGLTDVFLFGASLEHVTKMLPAHAFELIPAAPFTPSTEEILTHRRWGGVFEELAASQSRLLLYLPVTVDGAGAFSDRVGHTVILADRWEASTVIPALSVDADVMAYFAPPEPAVDDVASATEPAIAETPAAADAPAAAPRMADDDFARIRVPKDGAREALIADLRARQRAALQAPPPAIAPLPDEVDIVRERQPAPARRAGFPPAKPSITEPGFASTVRERPRRRVVLPALFVALLISGAAAGWHYWQGGSLAGFERGGTPAASPAMTRPLAPAPAPAEPPMPAGRPLPYSVAIAGYQLLDQAQERVDQLREESPMQFYIAPTVVQGSLFYRVLAGPLPDSTTAVAVRDTLVARRIKTMTLASDLLATPYAFLIGTFDRRNDAQALATEAAAKGVPAYVVPVGDAAGATTYRVYAGAYSGPGDAEFLREILKSAALPDSLVERTGSIRS